MSTQTNRRILNDLKMIKKDFDKNIYAEPLPDDLYLWNAVIIGQNDTIWEGGCFKLVIKFTNDYPTSPPTVKFVTPMFHPNSK